MAFFVNLLCVALYNYFGQAITKYINAITRMIVNAVKAVTTWVIGIIVTLA